MIQSIDMLNKQITPIGIGTFGSDHANNNEIADAVNYAIEIGFKIIDCASVYGNEKEIGNVFFNSINNRSEYFIISKVWNDMHNDVQKACEKSLNDLQLNYLDLYLVHWPFPNTHTKNATPTERQNNAKPFSKDEYIKTWRQMEKLYEQGIVKNIGMSNMTIKKLEMIWDKINIFPKYIESEIHPSFQQENLFNWCKEHKIITIAYSPLGSPNRPKRDTTENDVVDMQLPEVLKIAKKYNILPANVCLMWANKRGQIPIPMSLSKKNIKSNLESVKNNLLNNDDMNYLKDAERNCRLIKGQVFLWKDSKSWKDIWDE